MKGLLQFIVGLLVFISGVALVSQGDMVQAGLVVTAIAMILVVGAGGGTTTGTGTVSSGFCQRSPSGRRWCRGR